MEFEEDLKADITLKVTDEKQDVGQMEVSVALLHLLYGSNW